MDGEEQEQGSGGEGSRSEVRSGAGTEQWGGEKGGGSKW